MVFHLDWFHCTIDLKIQGCVIGVYQHFQQLVIYIVTTRHNGGEIIDSLNELSGKPLANGRCLETSTLEVGINQHQWC